MGGLPPPAGAALEAIEEGMKEFDLGLVELVAKEPSPVLA